MRSARRARAFASLTALLPAFLVLLTAATPVLAQGQEILDGLAWLQVNQDPTGAWGAGATRLRDTTTAVDTLHLLASSGLQRDRGDAWLRSAREASLDDGARRLVSLARAGVGAPALEVALFNARNAAEPNAARPNYPEGGWGLGPGYATDALDTALALEALAGSPFSGGLFVGNVAVASGTHNIHLVELPVSSTRLRIDITSLSGVIDLRIKEGFDPTLVEPFFHITSAPALILIPDSGLPLVPGTNHIRIDAPSGNSTYTMKVSYETASFDTRELDQALAYLRAAQNPDGGWGLRRGEDSHFFVTATVAGALGACSGVYDVNGAMVSALAYITAGQNPDSGFGSDPGVSTPADTALAVIALQADDPNSPVAGAGAGYLLSTQQPNGSWSDDPYATALAVRALAGPDPDADGDGVISVLDCAPANAGAFAPPNVVTSVSVTPGGTTTLSWDDQAAAIGPDSRYDIVTGSVLGFRADRDFSAATCLVDNHPAASHIDTRPDPVSGDAVYWLITSQNACGTAGYGSGDVVPDPRDTLATSPCSSPTTAPAVAITAPNDGATVNSQPITVSGTVSDSWASVDVNGVAAVVTGNTWTATGVPLVDGPNLVVATATGPGGLSSQDTITVTLSNPVDYSIQRGGSVNDSRVLTAAQAELDQIAFYQEIQTNVPANVTYTTTGVFRTSATNLRIDFNIAAGVSAATGIFDFDVTYVLLDGSLVEIFRRTLPFRIEVTP